MLFNSFHFLVFFIVVTSLYFALPHKYRWQMLLTASCYFYMVFVPVYILILGGTIVVDYFAGILIENAAGRRRKLFLIFSLVANIGVLAVFKYYNFLNDNLTAMLGWFHAENHIPYLSILLPIGLSFHTFQAMSYTIEVYRGNQAAERHFGIYSLYVMFYPQLVAGPIERPQNLLHQFREKHHFDYEKVSSGLRQMAWGLFKKTVIADRLSLVVDNVFNDPQAHGSFGIAIGAIFFTFQIYCDFSGYSDIAIGAARVMGFDLMTNFNLPFSSKSVTEFWRRWHISLSTWFNDYLFMPLVTAKRDWGKWALIYGLMLTFFLSGLWHGAGWNFIIYGLLHGLALSFELLTKKPRKRLKEKMPAWLFNSLAVTITVLYVTFSWVFFRAANVSTAFYMIEHFFAGIPAFFHKLASHQSVFEYLGVTSGELMLCVALILLLELLQALHRRYDLVQYLRRAPLVLRWSFYYSVIIAIIELGVFDDRQFIYFQF